jgi:glutathione S-transferase
MLKLDHDGIMVTHTTVINEYLEDAFPDAPPLRPADAAGKARLRYWNKFIDEHVMNFVSMWGWHRMVGVIARSVESGEFEKLLERIPCCEPLPARCIEWRTDRKGNSTT